MSSSRKGVKLGPILEVQGGESHAIEGAAAGDIVAIAKMEDLHTGTCLGDYLLPAIPIAYAHGGTGGDAQKSRRRNQALCLAAQDSWRRIPRCGSTTIRKRKELVLTGMSELHLQMIRERLHRRDKLDIDTHDPKIPFRETIQAAAEGSYRHKKQSRRSRSVRRSSHSHVSFAARYHARGVRHAAGKFPQMKDHHYDDANHFLWINTVVGGTIPSNFLPAVEKGFKERMARGVIAGHQVQDVAVEVHYGKYHDVDSSEAAFKTAGAHGVPQRLPASQAGAAGAGREDGNHRARE